MHSFTKQVARTLAIVMTAVAATVTFSQNLVLSQLGAGGVTETGGTAAYGHYIPRLNAAGKLSEAMMPGSLAAAAKSPYLVFVDSVNGADASTSGTISSPFKTLNSAMTSYTYSTNAGIVYVLLPGTHQQATFNPSIIPAQAEFSIVGLDPSATVISGVTVTGNEDAKITLSGVTVSEFKHLEADALELRIINGAVVSNMVFGGSVKSVLKEAGCHASGSTGAYVETLLTKSYDIGYSPTNTWNVAVTNVEDALDVLALWVTTLQTYTNRVQALEPYTNRVQALEPYTNRVHALEPYTNRVQALEPYTNRVQALEPYTNRVQALEPYTNRVQALEPYTNRVHALESLADMSGWTNYFELDTGYPLLVGSGESMIGVANGTAIVHKVTGYTTNVVVDATGGYVEGTGYSQPLVVTNYSGAVIPGVTNGLVFMPGIQTGITPAREFTWIVGGPDEPRIILVETNGLLHFARTSISIPTQSLESRAYGDDLSGMSITGYWYSNPYSFDVVFQELLVTNTTRVLSSAPLAFQADLDSTLSIATNALAVASTALQPPATNGLLRVEADTLATVTARGGTTTKEMTIGIRGIGAVGESSLAHGENVVASGNYSHAEGLYATASGDYSHAEGTYTTASGEGSHAEGVGTTAIRDSSHAEGHFSTASGEGSHAEGVYTTASGDYSHAEGTYTTASWYFSHAEGSGTTASGYASHASGFNSVASDITAFAWQGSDGGYAEPEYGSHGPGTYNLNPVGGLGGFYIGETPLSTTLSGYATTGAVAAVQAEIEAATSPKLTMVPTGTTVISTDTTVQVVPTRGIYNLYVQGDSDISFDLSSIDITNNVARWETWIKVFAPGMTVGLPSTNAVQYLETPDLTTTTANELLQISWQAWMDGTNLMMQGHLYNRNTQMPPPTLAELRTYHYGSPTIEESHDEWFVFDSGTGTITSFNYEAYREDVVIPWEIGGVEVEAIGVEAFSPGGSGLPIATVIGPKTLLSIGNGAFRSCGSMTSVSLPAATSIGDNAFSCTSLNSVSLPAATSIGNDAFYLCGSLTSVSLPAATSIGTGAFRSCGSMNSVSLPAATSIGTGAFWECTSLTTMSLPAASSIGNSAFSACYSLTSVYFGTSKPTEGLDIFYSEFGIPINATIYYPTGASAWSDVTTWGGMPTATYTPPAP